jgi:hypothetical protein
MTATAQNWIGGAAAIPQIDTFTPANVASGDTFSITVGGQTVTYTAGVSDTVAIVCAGLLALATAATAPPTFDDAAWTASATAVTSTGDAGVPLTCSSSASGGSATCTHANVQAASGPNWWSIAANWASGSVPATGDSATVGGGPDILYGLGQSAVTLTGLTINSPSTKIGLPIQNPGQAGAAYGEYRPQYLAIGATVLNIVQASGRVKIDNGSVQTTATVSAAQTGADSGLPAVLWKGTHASNALDVLGGTVGVSVLAGEVATLASLDAAGGTTTLGSGVTLGTAEFSDGANGTIQSSATTITLDPAAGTVDVLGGAGAAYTTIKVYGGTLSYQAGGTIAALYAGLKGSVNFSENIQARTVTDATLAAGATVTDSSKSVTWTNPLATDGCRLEDLSLDFGVGRTYAIAG